MRPLDLATVDDLCQLVLTAQRLGCVVKLTGASAELRSPEVVATRDTIRLAFVSTLQRLSPRQRAALVLCDVLRWPATEAFARFGFPAHL